MSSGQRRRSVVTGEADFEVSPGFLGGGETVYEKIFSSRK